MAVRLALLFCFLAAVHSKDIIQGLNGGRKIFEENLQASPAIWRQEHNVTVNTTNNEVISQIVVTDLRPDKDGDAKIVEGGEGNKTVTIELKSPTVLRGYDFHIEVYALSDENAPKENASLSNDQLYTGVSNDSAREDEAEEPLRFNIADTNIIPPKTLQTSSVKPPVLLTNDIEVENKRLTRSTPEGTIKHEDYSTTAKSVPAAVTGTTPKSFLVDNEKTDENKSKGVEIHEPTDKPVNGIPNPVIFSKNLENATHLSKLDDAKKEDVIIRMTRNTPELSTKHEDHSTTAKSVSAVTGTTPKTLAAENPEKTDENKPKGVEIYEPTDKPVNGIVNPVILSKNLENATHLSKLDDAKKEDQHRQVRDLGKESESENKPADVNNPSNVVKDLKVNQNEAKVKTNDNQNVAPKVTETTSESNVKFSTTEKSKTKRDTEEKDYSIGEEDLKHVQKIPPGPLKEHETDNFPDTKATTTPLNNKNGVPTAPIPISWHSAIDNASKSTIEKAKEIAGVTTQKAIPKVFGNDKPVLSGQ